MSHTKPFRAVASFPPGTRLSRLLQYLQMDPNNPSLRVDVIETCFTMGRVQHALDLANEGLRNAPGVVQLMNAKARALMSLGLHAEAVPLLKELLEVRSDANVAFSLSYAQAQLGEPTAAHETLAPYVTARPAAFVGAWWISCQHRLGELAGAIKFAHAHEARCADHAGFLGAASLAYFDGEEFDDAERASTAALVLDPAMVEALVVQASFALGRADAIMAQSLFGQALALRANDGRCLSGMGMAKLLAGDAAGAQSVLRNAVVVMPLHIGTWHALAWASLALHSLEDASAAVHAALNLDRTIAESHGALAVVAAVSGQLEDAEDAIERARRLDPDVISAQYAAMVLNGDVADKQKVTALARRVMLSRRFAAGVRHRT
jgi:tetratricopeptide (TPR) repeat protein